jgi:hypothetical protein
MVTALTDNAAGTARTESPGSGAGRRQQTRLSGGGHGGGFRQRSGFALGEALDRGGGRAHEVRRVVGVGQRGGTAYRFGGDGDFGPTWSEWRRGGRGIGQRGAGVGDDAVGTAARSGRRRVRRGGVSGCRAVDGGRNVARSGVLLIPHARVWTAPPTATDQGPTCERFPKIKFTPSVSTTELLAPTRPRR